MCAQGQSGPAPTAVPETKCPIAPALGGFGPLIVHVRVHCDFVIVLSPVLKRRGTAVEGSAVALSVTPRPRAWAQAGLLPPEPALDLLGSHPANLTSSVFTLYLITQVLEGSNEF